MVSEVKITSAVIFGLPEGSVEPSAGFWRNFRSVGEEEVMRICKIVTPEGREKELAVKKLQSEVWRSDF